MFNQTIAQGSGLLAQEHGHERGTDGPLLVVGEGLVGGDVSERRHDVAGEGQLPLLASNELLARRSSEALALGRAPPRLGSLECSSSIECSSRRGGGSGGLECRGRRGSWSGSGGGSRRGSWSGGWSGSGHGGDFRKLGGVGDALDAGLEQRAHGVAVALLSVAGREGPDEVDDVDGADEADGDAAGWRRAEDEEGRVELPRGDAVDGLSSGSQLFRVWRAGFACCSQSVGRGLCSRQPKCGTRALHAAAKVWGAYQAGVALLAAVDGHNDVIGEDEVVVGDPDGLVGNED